MIRIWATRGRSWGFRFLRSDGPGDPLPTYEAAFEGMSAGAEVWRRSDTTVAVRFPDPLGRTDSAGRVIPHEFVLDPPLADEVDTVEDAREIVWPLVAEEYDRVWQEQSP